MVRSSLGVKLFLVLVTAMASVVRMAPTYSPQTETEDNESYQRNARSTNLSNSKIRLHVHGYFLQILADGTVNGTVDENPYSIMDRRSVSFKGDVRIQGVATCSFLCLNECGFLYASKEYNDECVLKESFAINDQNTYISVKYSNANHTLYLALNKNGHVRRVQTKTGAPLSKYSSSANVLTLPVSDDNLKRLEKEHEFRHHKLCPSPAQHKSIKTKCKHRRTKKPVTKSSKDGEEENPWAAMDAASPPPKHKISKKRSRGDADCLASTKKCRKHKTHLAGEKKHQSPMSETLTKPSDNNSEGVDEREATTVAQSDDGET